MNRYLKITRYNCAPAWGYVTAPAFSIKSVLARRSTSIRFRCDCTFYCLLIFQCPPFGEPMRLINPRFFSLLILSSTFRFEMPIFSAISDSETFLFCADYLFSAGGEHSAESSPDTLHYRDSHPAKNALSYFFMRCT